MDGTNFTFDTKDLLEKLRKKDFVEDIYDSNYNGKIKARGYVDNSEKGIYSGVMETQTDGQNHPLVTFFKVSYIDGTFKMWNSSKKELVITTQNLNRLFRNGKIIRLLEDDGMNELLYRALAFERSRISSSYTVYAYDTPIGFNILDSLKPGMELAYLTCKNIGIIDDSAEYPDIVANTHALRNVYALVNKFVDESLNYKKVLKLLGLTKGDIRNVEKDSLLTAIEKIQISETRRGYYYNDDNEEDSAFYDKIHADINYATGSLVEKEAWFRTARAYIDIGNLIVKNAEEVGYSITLSEAINDTYRLDELATSIKRIMRSYPNKEVNLDKIIRYLYVDINMHQGISNFASAISLYKDYTELVAGIKEFTVFPRYLTVAHDIAAKAFKSVASSEEERKVAEFTNRFSNIEGLYTVNEASNNKKVYPLVLLRSATEIVEEATNQSNCLASYVKNVVKHKDLIISLKDPDIYEKTGELKSFVSIQVHIIYDDLGEVSDLYLSQAYKTFNSRLDSKEMGVLKAILSEKDIKTDRYVTGYGNITSDNTLKATVVKKQDISKVYKHDEVDFTEEPNDINKFIARI